MEFLDINGVNKLLTLLKTEINNKIDEGGGGSGELPTITGNRVAVSNSAGTIIASEITTTELDNLDNIKSNIQDQIDGKANTTHTHELSDVIGHYGDRVIVSFNSSTVYLEESSVTKKELEYLKGCSGYIQTQIDSLDERISSIGGGGSGGGGTCNCSAIDPSDIETSFNKIMDL